MQVKRVSQVEVDEWTVDRGKLWKIVKVDHFVKNQYVKPQGTRLTLRLIDSNYQHSSVWSQDHWIATMTEEEVNCLA